MKLFKKNQIQIFQYRLPLTTLLKNSLLILGLSLTSLAQAQVLGGTQFNGLSYGGSGCPQGSVNTVFSPDSGQFSILYSAFSLNVGGYTQQTTDTMSCDVVLNFRLPFGYALNVESADFRGSVVLDNGVVAQHTVEHQINENKLATFGFGVQLFAGPRQENYFIQSQKPNLKLPKLVQCLPLKQNVNLKIKTRVKMTGATSSRVGILTVDSADGQLEQKYYLSLRKCF